MHIKLNNTLHMDIIIGITEMMIYYRRGVDIVKPECHKNEHNYVWPNRGRDKDGKAKTETSKEQIKQMSLMMKNNAACYKFPSGQKEGWLWLPSKSTRAEKGMQSIMNDRWIPVN